jgi:hypothetical protein
MRLETRERGRFEFLTKANRKIAEIELQEVGGIVGADVVPHARTPEMEEIKLRKVSS